MNGVPEYVKFFFNSALITYVSGSDVSIPPVMLNDPPGTKRYQVEDGSLLYLDSYWVNGGASVGNTLIYDRDIWEENPIWSMSYGGYCDPAWASIVHPFLKCALKENYSGAIFNGGRGPEMYKKPGIKMIYRNNKIVGNTFLDFRGEERIIHHPHRDGSDPFWHLYFGRLMLPH